MNNTGIKTFTASGALGAHIRVKATAGSTTTPPQVEVAGAGEQHIGVTEAAAADGAAVAVRLRTAPGTVEVTAAGAITQGATVYGAALGKVDDAASGTAIGTALQAATAAGDIIEMADTVHVSTTAATVSIADAGGFTAQTTVEAAVQEILQDLLSAQCFLPLPLMGFREVGTNDIQALAAHGGILAKDSTPILEFTNLDTDSAIRLRWAASDSNAIACQVPLPPDLDPTADLVIHLRAAMAGATDTPVFSADSFFNEGDTKVEDDSAAITGATPAEYTVTIAAADIPAGAQTLSVELTPGAHTTDALYLYAAWLEYTRAIRTS